MITYLSCFYHTFHFRWPTKFQLNFLTTFACAKKMIFQNITHQNYVFIVFCIFIKQVIYKTQLKLNGKGVYLWFTERIQASFALTPLY